jgi:hypothetical protein
VTPAGVERARLRRSVGTGRGGLGRGHRGLGRSPAGHDCGSDAAPTLFDGLGGEPTLDDVLAGAWEGLIAHSVVSCPVCGDEMAPQYSAHASPVGGRCRGCGSTLS